MFVPSYSRVAGKKTLAFWTHSMSVLLSLNNTLTRFTVFLGIRVANTEVSSATPWGYVNSQSNADHTSCGLFIWS